MGAVSKCALDQAPRQTVGSMEEGNGNESVSSANCSVCFPFRTSIRYLSRRCAFVLAYKPAYGSGQDNNVARIQHFHRDRHWTASSGRQLRDPRIYGFLRYDSARRNSPDAGARNFASMLRTTGTKPHKWPSLRRTNSPEPASARVVQWREPFLRGSSTCGRQGDSPKGFGPARPALARSAG